MKMFCGIMLYNIILQSDKVYTVNPCCKKQQILTISYHVPLKH